MAPPPLTAPANVVPPTPAPVTPAKPAADPQAGTVPPPETELVKAQAGVAKAGRSLDPHEGMLVTPAKTYFAVRERLMFEATIPQALNLYKATNGKFPQSHDEFMAQIIQAGQIQLPQLPEGQRYVWDPNKEELMVARPKQ